MAQPIPIIAAGISLIIPGRRNIDYLHPSVPLNCLYISQAARRITGDIRRVQQVQYQNSNDILTSSYMCSEEHKKYGEYTTEEKEFQFETE